MLLRKLLIAAAVSLFINIIFFISVLMQSNTFHGLFSELTSLFIFISIFIFMLGLPVSILAYFIVRDMEDSRMAINFVIHIGSSVIIGFLLFKVLFFFVILTFVAGFLFFIGDEVFIFQNEHTRKINKLWSAVSVLLLILVISAPILWIFPNQDANLNEADAIDKNLPPGLTLIWNESSIKNISPVHCKQEEKECQADRAPYKLPEAGANLDIVDSYYTNTVEFEITNRIEEPSYEFFYLEGAKVKKIGLVDNKLVIPYGLKAQVMKGNLIWEDEVLSFSIAVK
ncbi:hypothetical protein [Metabacillus idriensis]|uniref:hypothetical protein n=1 Tax=Metabacillus idriensis TaxID=324768 RepID=UPI00174919CA|nr:hypothetical protein [Metabacillus idriensis]